MGKGQGRRGHPVRARPKSASHVTTRAQIRVNQQTAHMVARRAAASRVTAGWSAHPPAREDTDCAGRIHPTATHHAYAAEPDCAKHNSSAARAKVGRNGPRGMGRAPRLVNGEHTEWAPIPKRHLVSSPKSMRSNVSVLGDLVAVLQLPEDGEPVEQHRRRRRARRARKARDGEHASKAMSTMMMKSTLSPPAYIRKQWKLTAAAVLGELLRVDVVDVVCI